MLNDNILLERILQLEEENRNLKDNMKILSHWVLNSLTYESLVYKDGNYFDEMLIYKEKWRILTEELKFGEHGNWILNFYDELKDDLLIKVLNYTRGVETKYF